MTIALIVLQVLSLATNVHLYLRKRQLEEERRELREELRASRQREHELTERMIAARKDGFEIPPEPPVVPTLEPEPELAPRLLAIVDDWESEDARNAQREVIKQYKRQGLSDLEIVRRLVPAEEMEGVA